MIAAIARALGAVAGAPARTGELAFLLRHGGSGPDDTSQAFVFDRSGALRAVAKAARGATGRVRLTAEHDRLGQLGPALIAAHPGSVPVPLGLALVDDWTVLLESPLGGRRLKDLGPAAARDEVLLERVVDFLVDLARLGPRRLVPLGEVTAMVEARVAEYLGAFEPGPAEERLLARLAPSLDRHGPERMPLVPLHGDFSDANLLVDGRRLGVVDWDEPVGLGLPGTDLLHFLASLALSRAGLGSEAAFERGFRRAFLAATGEAGRNRRLRERYRRALDLPAELEHTLAVLAWLDHALRKLGYLERQPGPRRPARSRAGALVDPQEHYPLTFFAGGRCLNLALLAEAQP